MTDFTWEKDEAGNLILFRLEGYQTATLSEKDRLLRVEWLLNPGQPTEGLVGVQLALSREQAREVGQVLLELAEAPHILAPPTRSKH